jgi:hypothetical protein
MAAIMEEDVTAARGPKAVTIPSGGRLSTATALDRSVWVGAGGTAADRAAAGSGSFPCHPMSCSRHEILNWIAMERTLAACRPAAILSGWS